MISSYFYTCLGVVSIL